MQFGIYGCEHNHIAIFIKEMLDEGHHCIGVYEPSNHRLADSVCLQFNIQRLKHREALLAPEVEVIGSAAVNEEKLDVIEWCHEHGKHVMVDKPAVTNAAQLERLLKILKAGRIQVGMLLTERFHPAIVAIKQQLDHGAVGEIISIQIRKPHRLSADNRPDWFFSKQRSGGIMIDLLVHDLDLANWFTSSRPIMRHGYMLKRILPGYESFYDTAALQLLYGNGTAVQLYADWHTPNSCWTWGDGRIIVTGTKGILEARLSGEDGQHQEPVLTLMTHDQELRRLPPKEPPTTITADFLRRIAGERCLLRHEDIAAALQEAVAADREAFALRSTEHLSE